MRFTPCLPKTARHGPLLAMLVLLALVHGCAATSGNSLLVRTGEASKTQYLPDEFERLMDALGYEWLPVTDPDIGHPVKIATIYGEYRMRFQARDATGFRIDVHIRQNGQSTGLHFTQDGSESLDAEALQRYRQLRERLEFEFGAGNVSGNRPLLTP